MKIEDVRPSFSAYVIVSETKTLEMVNKILDPSGYMVAQFTQLSAAFSEFPSNPPHFILFSATETTFDVRHAITQVLNQLPESHVFLLVPWTERSQYTPWLEQGVHDLIYLPITTPAELLHHLDHAAERDYFMYMNERLVANPPSAPPPQPSQSAVASDFSMAREIFAQMTADDCVATFLRLANSALSGQGAVFFKYVPNRRVLIAHRAEGVDGVDLGGLGLNFNELESDFRASHLREPDQIEELKHLVHEVFACDDFFFCPVEVQGDVQGVIAFLRPPVDGPLQIWLEDGLYVLGKALAMLDVERRLHVNSIKDPSCDVLNKANFDIRIQQEISRARRTNLPVSLLSVAFDQYGQIVSQVGAEEAQTMLRMAARIIEKHSRVIDVVGRTGVDEFGILLPHTNKKGAMVKAERLRQLLDQADFSRVIKNFAHISLSIGVSEYPSLVRDAVELQQSADEALYQVRRNGNKTCVAQAPANFTPDFEVNGGSTL